MGELRKIVAKLAGEQARNMSDHDIHTLGVGYASVQGFASKLLTKALDQKHAAVIKRFSAFKSEDDIRLAWKNARQECAVEGAYWAIATHPMAGEGLFREVFGHIHMLSHLVGASNRAELKRLVDLEQEKETLIQQMNSTRSEMRRGWASRDKELQELRSLLARPQSVGISQPDETEISAFKKAIRHLESQLSSEETRRKSLELKASISLEESRNLRIELGGAKTEIVALKSEIAALENYFNDHETTLRDLDGKAVLYVGGVAKGIKFIRAYVEKTGASFVHHDGGKEQATILLRGLIGRADIVLFPVDFVSHDAANICKTICLQQSKPFFPLPHAGVGSVMRVLSNMEL